MTNTIIDCHLSLKDTYILKGLAICGMLCWHLFYCPNLIGVTFSNFIRWIGLLGDVCVSAFLFVSGYGLSIKYMNSQPTSSLGSVKFIFCRIVKFYANYWPVLLFVLPIGILGFNRPLTDSDSASDICCAWIKEILAIAGHSSYNPSWWFNALILELYLLFPILFWCLKNACIPTLFLLFFLKTGNIYIYIYHIGMNMQIYLPIFILGMFMAIYGNKISTVVSRLPKFCCHLLGLCCMIGPAVALPLFDDGAIYATGIMWYGLFTVGLVLMIISFKKHQTRVSQWLAYLGKHSSNIYLIHTMVYFYWFPQIYRLRYPIVLFVALMGISLVFSIVLEKIKAVSGYNRVVKKVLIASDTLEKRSTGIFQAM